VTRLLQQSTENEEASSSRGNGKGALAISHMTELLKLFVEKDSCSPSSYKTRFYW
jgi:hypothetical protein